MLVLSRAIGQSIVIGGHIVVTVADVRGDKAKIGIEAPRDVPVFRGELGALVKSRTPPDVITACTVVSRAVEDMDHADALSALVISAANRCIDATGLPGSEWHKIVDAMEQAIPANLRGKAVTA